jgi:acetyltransferase-like isoleucine patch superfamily enzyme
MTTARTLASVLVVPMIISYRIESRVLGPHAALEYSTQALGLIPGVVGDFLRAAFLSRVLRAFAPSATIRFGSVFSHAGARVASHVYVGPHCDLGFVQLDRDVLLASGVHVLSGSATHGVADVDTPIREQPGIRTMVRIGEGTWIGSRAIVMADVGQHCVVGAGAVVTRAIPDYSVAVGNPARVIRDRRAWHDREAVGPRTRELK